MSDQSSTNHDVMTQREVVGGLIGAGGAMLGSATTARAQTETPTGGQAQITTMAVIPQVGPPFEGNYTGQFVIFTDSTPRDEVSPEVIAECEGVNWTPEQTRGYQVLIADRLTDEPQGVSVQAFLNGNDPRVDLGNAFIINNVHSCPGDYLELEFEEVPIETFNPRYGTEDGAIVGESPGPGVSPTDAPDGIDAPGQPGFGALAALAGLGIAGLVRRLRRRS